MAMRTKVIGPISAYAIAVSKGYTGTEEEFAQQIADAANNAAAAEAAAETAQVLVESLPSDFETTQENFAPLYADLTFPVKKGQHCIYGGIYYEANTDIASSEAWTAAHWTQRNVGAEVSDLKSAIQNDLMKSEKSAESQFEVGGLNTSNGNTLSSTTRIRTKTYIDEQIVAVEISGNHSMLFLAYDSNGYVGYWNGSEYEKPLAGATLNWISGTFFIPQIAKYKYKIAVRNNDDSTITTAAYNSIAFIKAVNTIELDSRVTVLEDNVGSINESIIRYNRGDTVNITEWSNGYYTNATPPVFTSSNDYKTSALFEINNDGAYDVRSQEVGNGTHRVTVFDSNQNPIGWGIIGAGGTEISSATFVNSYENAAYVAITVRKNNTPTVYNMIAYNVLSATIPNWLYGKKIGCLGDSLTYGQNIPNLVWGKLIADRNGMTFYNYGENGSSVAKLENPTGIDSMVERFPDMVEGLDYVTVMGGANDMNQEVPIGENSDTTPYTFKGALKILIDGLRQKYPKAHIIFMTNFKRRGTSNEKAYVTAMQEICAMKAIPCKNNYEQSGIDFTDANQAAVIEGVDVHFSAYGNEYISYGIEEFLRSH